MLKRKPWFLPIKSIPAIIGFLVLMGCSYKEISCLPQGSPTDMRLLSTDKVVKGVIYRFVHSAVGVPGMWVPIGMMFPNGGTQMSPVDGVSENPPRYGGAGAQI